MEPITFIAKALTIICLTAMPVQPATVPGSIEMETVSNTTVITSTANRIDADEKAAAEKAAAEKAAKEKAAKEAAEKAAKAEEEKKAAEKKAAERLAAQRAAAAQAYPGRIMVTNMQPETTSVGYPLKPGTYTITSGFGGRCAPVAGAGDYHYGLDLAAPMGTPIYALADGTVTTVTDGVTGGQAGIVTIESIIDGNLVTHMYAHMENSSKYVKVGDIVKAGQHISNVGTTGMSTGAHLHLEIWDGVLNVGPRLDPVEYLPSLGVDIVGKANGSYLPLVSVSCKTEPAK